MRRSIHSALVVATLAVVTSIAPLFGQTPQDNAVAPAFEVATVKQNRSGDLEQHILRQPGGGLTVTNMPVQQLILFAYVPLQSFQLVGGPSWIGNVRFDMVAKIGGNPPPTLPGIGPDALMLAMRTLLADRFKLELHHEQREMDIYALVLAKPASGPGASLKQSTTDCEAFVQAHRGGLPAPTAPGTLVCGVLASPGQIRMGGFPLSRVTTALSAITGRMVADRTGLLGNWDLTLTFAPEPRGQPGVDLPAPDPSAPSIFTALQEQLGLKLESTKGLVDVLVIDHVEEPTPE